MAGTNGGFVSWKVPHVHCDHVIRAAAITTIGEQAAHVESLGFAGAGVTETNGNPFLAAAQAAQSTTSIRVSTAIALAFPRTPMDVAYTSWDLQALSGGRFALGLGTQVRAHVERRYGAVWSRPAARMRGVRARAARDLGGLGDGRRPHVRGRLLPPHADAAELPPAAR